MVLAVGLNHSAEAARAQQQVTDATNTLLKKNAQMLKLGYGGDGQGVGARDRGYGNLTGYQQAADFHFG